MTADQYSATRALSNSGMTDLAVSPMRYWHRWINPERVQEPPTPAMVFGSALHCAILEPSEFDKRYVRQADPKDYDGLLVTVDDLKGWLADHGIKASCKNKAEWIARVRSEAPEWPIMDCIVADHARKHEGKQFFNPEDWERLQGATAALMDEPEIARILDAGGKVEYPLFAKDPQYGCNLKGRLDWLSESILFDIKTFSQKRGKTIDLTVRDAIWYENYHRQAAFYFKLARLNGYLLDKSAHAVLAFVESDAPHEVRIFKLTPGSWGVRSYWMLADSEINTLTWLFDKCLKQFGDKPWREPRVAEWLEDSDLKQVAFAPLPKRPQDGE